MPPTEKSIATVTIHGAATMGARERRRIASWLRHAADMLLTTGPKMSKRFTARYLKVSQS